jgi:glycosyltransferase involved in cell wall biosynthesis
MLVVMKALRKNGVEPYVVMHSSGYFGKLLRREGIKYEVVRLSEPITNLSRNRPIVWHSVAIVLEIGRLAAAVRRIARRWKIEALHVHHPYGYIACGLAARRMGIPCIWHLHEGWEKSATTRMLVVAGWVLADHVITIAPYEHSTVVALTDRIPHTMIENAFDFEELRQSRTRSRFDVRAELDHLKFLWAT